MPPSSNKPDVDAILAVLRAAQDAGVGKLTRTALIKFLYLVDLYVAEENAGKTLSGAEWTFLHFGPYAATLDRSIDSLANLGSIQSDVRDSADKEISLFYLGEWSNAKTLEELGLSYDVRSRLVDDIKSFAFDLPGLLDKVYFHTEPMRKAVPGQALNFSKASRINFKSDIMPYKVSIADKKKASRIKELVASLGESRRSRAFSLSNPPIRDAYYFAALHEPDESIPDGEFIADLEFEDSASNS